MSSLFAVRYFSHRICCVKNNTTKKDVCHKTKQMIAMKNKKGSRLIVYGVFFLFLPYFIWCWMYFCFFFVVHLWWWKINWWIFQWKLLSKFQHIMVWRIFLIIIRLQFVFFCTFRILFHWFSTIRCGALSKGKFPWKMTSAHYQSFQSHIREWKKKQNAA